METPDNMGFHRVDSSAANRERWTRTEDTERRARESGGGLAFDQLAGRRRSLVPRHHGRDRCGTYIITVRPSRAGREGYRKDGIVEFRVLATCKADRSSTRVGFNLDDCPKIRGATVGVPTVHLPSNVDPDNRPARRSSRET